MENADTYLEELREKLVGKTIARVERFGLSINIVTTDAEKGLDDIEGKGSRQETERDL